MLISSNTEKIIQEKNKLLGIVNLAIREEVDLNYSER